MPDQENSLSWDFESAIDLLGKLSFTLPSINPESPLQLVPTPPLSTPAAACIKRTGSGSGSGLGDFGSLWDLLGSSTVADKKSNSPVASLPKPHPYKHSFENGTSTANNSIRSPNADGAILEDNSAPELEHELEPELETEPKLGLMTRTQRRVRNSAKASQRATKPSFGQSSLSDTENRPESGNELKGLSTSPDRRAIIDSILGRTRPSSHLPLTPASSSPPKASTSPKKQRALAQSSLWTAPGVPSPSRYVIAQRDGLMNRDRIRTLISQLQDDFPQEKKYLKNKGLIEPTFTALNVSDIGIHVFIDVSNISIGFHDCLKLSRGLDPKRHVKQIPMNFHLFSLVLERGRPATKRVLVGSDKSALVDQAKALGFETNILERVHKVKELTARQIKFSGRSGGETSGSETNTGSTPRAQKWVEQAVDEILHLKILESLIDYSDRPATIVLATGDAAEAEYSDGFLRMVERALEKGWAVELVSFKLNTSNLYKRKDFRRRWGAMFKWIQLDDYAEMLIASDDNS